MMILITTAVSCVQELQLTAWFPLSFSIFQYCYTSVMFYIQAQKEEAGVEVRDWEIQLGGKKMKR